MPNFLTALSDLRNCELPQCDNITGRIIATWKVENERKKKPTTIEVLLYQLVLSHLNWGVKVIGGKRYWDTIIYKILRQFSDNTRYSINQKETSTNIEGKSNKSKAHWKRARSHRTLVVLYLFKFLVCAVFGNPFRPLVRFGPLALVSTLAQRRGFVLSRWGIPVCWGNRYPPYERAGFTSHGDTPTKREKYLPTS